MTDETSDTAPLTAEQKKTQLATHLSEAYRLAAEIQAAGGNRPASPAGRFGVSTGPAVPDLQTARNTERVRRALASLEAAETELTIAETLAAVIQLAGQSLGLKL